MSTAVFPILPILHCRPVTVNSEAQLAILDITGPISVFRGQQDQILTVEIANTGETTALIDTLYLTRQIGLYTITRITATNSIAGGDTTLFDFDVDISPTSATGTDNFGAVVDYRDSLSLTPGSDTGTNLHSWTIFEELDVEILSVNSGRPLP